MATRESGSRTPLPGSFVQDEWALNDDQKLLMGYRVDHDPNMAWRTRRAWPTNGRPVGASPFAPASAQAIVW